MNCKLKCTRLGYTLFYKFSVEPSGNQSLTYITAMMPLFEFIDYRKYLASYYEHKKKSTKSFSYRYFAQKAKIHSPSRLKEVIDGERNLTRRMIDNFSVGLGLNERETVYFRNLVLFNQAKTSAEKQEYYTNLRAMFGTVKESILSPDQYDYFAKWYIPVLRELICRHDFKDDYKLMASMLIPQIMPSEAKTAIKLLLRMKLLRRKKDGTYVQSDSAIVADNSVMSLAMRSFIKAMIEHSCDAVEKIDWRIRHISGITIGITPAAFDVIASEIEAFKDRVKLIVSRENMSTQVYQMNVSLFPVSRNINEIPGRDADK
jgi:uncharacterized protein (TIGR02147 family)